MRVRISDTNTRNTAPLSPTQRDEPRRGGFQKGHKLSKGRPKGIPNKTTTLLKDAIIAAGQEAGQHLLADAIAEAKRDWRRAQRQEADETRIGALKEVYDRMRAYHKEGPDGLVEYLKWLALTYPKSYTTLLGRVLPYHLVAKVDHTHKEYSSKDEIMERLKESGVPVHMLNN